MSGDYFAEQDLSSMMTPEGGAPAEYPVTPPAVIPEATPAAGEPSSPPSTFTVGDYGNFTAEQLQEFFGRFTTLEEQAKTWGDVQTERQKIESERTLMREAIRLHNLAQNPEVRKLLEPFLQGSPESPARDAENGRFTGKLLGAFQDPRLTDDFIRQAQEDHQFVHHARESFADAQIDKTWEGIKEQYPGVVDDAFEQKIADFVLAEEKRTGRPVEPIDLLKAAALELAASGKLISLGRQQAIDELNKQPKGTQVITSGDQPPVQAPIPPGRYSWRDFEQQVANLSG